MSFKHLQTATDKLGYLHEEGEGQGYLFLNGRHMSLADGHPVASSLYEFFTGEGVACTFFDYGGWGASASKTDEDNDEAAVPRPKFELARWLGNALDVLDHTTKPGEKQVLVGYSIGFWLALAMWLRRPDKVGGIVGISPSIVKYMEVTKRHYVPDEEDSPLIQLQWAEAPHRHPQLVASPLEVDIPIRLIHGLADPMSPYATSISLAERISAPDLELKLVQHLTHDYDSVHDIDALISLFI